jgi:hypothetical protein
MLMHIYTVFLIYEQSVIFVVKILNMGFCYVVFNSHMFNAEVQL